MKPKSDFNICVILIQIEIILVTYQSKFMTYLRNIYQKYFVNTEQFGFFFPFLTIGKYF